MDRDDANWDNSSHMVPNEIQFHLRRTNKPSKHDIPDRLPVVVVISEETTSRHINVLLFLFLLLLLLLGLLLSGSGSRGGGGSSSANTCPSARKGKCTGSGDQVQNVRLGEVGSENHGPVGSDGVSGGLHDLVQVVLLQLATSSHSHGHVDLGISAQESGERNDELLLLSSRHRFKGSHDG